MSEERHPFLNTGRVIGVVVGMFVVVFGIGELVRDNRHDHSDEIPDLHGISHDPVHDVARTGTAGRTVTFSAPVVPAEKPDIAVRNLSTYYGRRAYAGAPPMIPHEVDPEIERTQACNTCHEQGGFVAKFNAWTPLTPHPEYENCLQCHVRPDLERELFVASQWLSARSPRLQRAALPGSPPPIPHTLQLRDNCITCHAGPAAPLDIRTTHPERVNCIQCHASPQVTGTFQRPGPGGS